jgi:thymidine kinase
MYTLKDIIKIKMITLLMGPMFSGKTTLLLGYERRFRIAKHQVLLIKYGEDNRYSKTNIVSHDGVSSSNEVYNTMKLLEVPDETVQSFGAILIDEGQFFEDLPEFCERYAHTKQIVISGLSGDYQRRPFSSIAAIIPMSDKVYHCKGICTQCGADAPYSKRITDESDQKVIGGVDKYQPRCRKCFSH